MYNESMSANLYKTDGAYHWDWYNNRRTYNRHVQFLKRFVTEKNVIDIGAGDGLITHMLSIRGVDNDRTAIQLAGEKGVKIDEANASRLPYKDEQFDSALFSDTLSYFRDITRPLSEARRVIKKYLYVSLPTSENVSGPGMQHAFSQYELVANVEKQGFRLIDGPRYKYDRKRYYFKFQKA